MQYAATKGKGVGGGEFDNEPKGGLWISIDCRSGRVKTSDGVVPP